MVRTGAFFPEKPNYIGHEYAGISFEVRLSTILEKAKKKLCCYSKNIETTAKCRFKKNGCGNQTFC